jgi:hypothetical protein
MQPCVKGRRGNIPTHCSAECAIEDRPAATKGHPRVHYTPRIEGFTGPLDYFQTALMRRTTSCILWPYANTGEVIPHGRILIAKQVFITSRLACWFRWGPPAGPWTQWHAAHGPCSSSLCTNPAHTSWLSNADNQHDRWRDGTDCFGEKNPRARFTNAIIRDMRSQSADGTATAQQLATRYGTDPSYIRLIIERKRWKHIA